MTTYQDPDNLDDYKLGSKKRIVRIKKKGDDDVASVPAGDASNGATQIVHSVDESNALVQRLKQLESEGSTLAASLSRVCEENASLTREMTLLQKKVTDMTTQPFAGTSVLQSLFEPEKTGWFGGSKSAARTQLEKMCEALQNEFVEYKSTHPTTQDEVEALVTGLHSATTNAQELSKVIKEQQDLMSDGNPKSISIRILPIEDAGASSVIGELKAQLLREQKRSSDLNDKLLQTNESLRAKCDETIKLQNSLKAASESRKSSPANAPSAATDGELQRLRTELEQLRSALATEEQLHQMKCSESDEYSRRLESERQTHQSQVADLQKQVAAGKTAVPATCSRCETLRSQLADAKMDAENARKDLQAIKAQMLDTTAKQDKNYAALQAKLVECQRDLSAQQSAVSRTVSTEQYSKLDLEKNALAHEVSLCKERIKYLEDADAKRKAATKDNVVAADDLDTTQVLQTLNSNKERIAKLEFEKEQLTLQLQQAQAYAVSRDQEAQRLERATTEDKQRIAFLLKKCAAVTADQRTLQANKEAAEAELEQHKTENKKLQRQIEEIPALQAKLDQIQSEKKQLEERIASTSALEDKYVKAKETIAYMELAQSRSINMSQYAELQAEKEKLEHTMTPMKKQLDDANKEIERLRSITDAQHTVSVTQKNSVQGWQDKVNQLSDSEAKLKEQVSMLSTENERLRKVNESLETQMSDMQDGIREMALKMDNERTTAKTTAEAQSQKELAALRMELEKAKNTIAEVQSTQGQFVAEGLYKSVVDERDKQNEEMKKKNADLEKLKSEILIYRQTIVDLEAENDEHVKQIEALQEKYQQDRSALSEKYTVEQKKSTELTDNVDHMKEDLMAKQAQIEKDAETIKDLEDKVNKQRRAFEDKCRSEETLRAQIEQLQKGASLALASAVVAPVAATAPPVTASSPPAPTPSPDRQYQLQCENDRLRGEIKRIQAQQKADAEDDQRTIMSLQTQIKSRMSGTDRAAYDIEINRSAALKKSNEALLSENEDLKKKLATNGGGGAFYGRDAALPSTAAATGAGGAATQMRIMELEAKLQQEEAALAEAQQQVAALEDRVRELEEQGDENGVKNDPLAPDKPKKKVKKIKKKKTLADQVVGEDGADVLATPEGATPRGAAGDGAAAATDVAGMQASLSKLEHEIDMLKKENATLKESNARLTKDLENAQEELEAAYQDMDDERSGMHKRMKALEASSGALSRMNSSIPQSPNSSFQRQSIQDVEVQVRCLQDENDRLKSEIKKNSLNLSTAEATQELKRLRRELRNKDAEILALTNQLMPTKQKLVEYMALADRLGISYPFSPELEGTTVMRLKSLHLKQDRAISAPAPTTNVPPTALGVAPMTSPPPKPPQAKRTKRSGRHVALEDEDVSLR